MPVPGTAALLTLGYCQLKVECLQPEAPEADELFSQQKPVFKDIGVKLWSIQTRVEWGLQSPDLQIKGWFEPLLQAPLGHQKSAPPAQLLQGQQAGNVTQAPSLPRSLWNSVAIVGK